MNVRAVIKIKWIDSGPRLLNRRLRLYPHQIYERNVTALNNVVVAERFTDGLTQVDKRHVNDDT